MEVKICKICQTEKSLSEFNFRKDTQKYRNECKECFYKINKKNKADKVEYYQEYNKEYRVKNLDKLKQYQSGYYKQNRERLIKKQHIYHINNPDVSKTYRQLNKSKINEKNREYYKNKIKLDIKFKVKENVRKLIQKSFKANSFKKETKTQDILGCTPEQFKQHLEKQFQPWMTWDNYGLYNGQAEYGWDIDHIIPLKTAKTVEDIIRLNHYTNLQPLCSYQNRIIKRITQR